LLIVSFFDAVIFDFFQAMFLQVEMETHHHEMAAGEWLKSVRFVGGESGVLQFWAFVFHLGVAVGIRF